MKKVKKETTLKDAMGYIFVSLGSIGFVSAFTLAIDKIAILKDPNYVPTCSISPLISCGSVMQTPQSEVFGFLNPLLGIAGFAVIITIGMAIIAGATFKRWFWLGMQAGATLGVVFISWLYYQSVFTIGALCPFCMVVWAITLPLFWYITLYNLRTKVITYSPKWKHYVDFMQKHHGDILLAWFGIGIGIIVIQFWYYWSTLIG